MSSRTKWYKRRRKYDKILPSSEQQTFQNKIYQRSYVLSSYVNQKRKSDGLNIFSEQADQFWNLVEKKSNETEDGVFYLNL